MKLDDIDGEAITVEQFASLMQVGLRQAYAVVNSGAIYSARIGRSIRIPKAAVERYLAGGIEKNDLGPGKLKVVGGGGDHPRSG